MYLSNSIGTLGAFAGRSLVLEGALLAELEFLACVASPVVGIAFAVVARGLATRISERMDYAERLETGNLRLTELVAKVG